jgi:hypothetical protein
LFGSFLVFLYDGIGLGEREVLLWGCYRARFRRRWRRLSGLTRIRRFWYWGRRWPEWAGPPSCTFCGAARKDSRSFLLN